MFLKRWVLSVYHGMKALHMASAVYRTEMEPVRHANIQAGGTILLAGAEPTAQVAIQIAQLCVATVVTTKSSSESLITVVLKFQADTLLEV